MKKYAKCLALLLFILNGSDLFAQEVDSSRTNRPKWYLGVGLSNSIYYLFYDQPKNPNLLLNSRFSPVDFHLRYRVNQRLHLEGGLAYGGDKFHIKSQGVLTSGEMVEEEHKSRTHVIALPLTAKLILINANKALPIYVTGSVMPAYGTTRYLNRRTGNNETTTVFDVQDEGINVFAMAGVGFNYKIWRRFSGKAELLLLRRNLTNHYGNVKRGDPWGERAVRSLAIGFNYYLGKRSR
ncbi:outer membrane beta-barrel protein [Rufibacter sediminis]|uniref:Outer membrane beta-barrel protein n=1 Tax=Rufibacter sediminis TaxID=2762756 RepID=A0ABR6VVZ2_9BACT|nr:outer membrane beta-barrel protein [Rufibacter sediminis]MBC3540998.1 outer membrane beta-barrel protein [Rufibacter sediminis]